MISNNMTDAPSAAADEEGRSGWYWYRRGMRNLLSTPAIVLYFSYLGFGSFTYESGVDVYLSMFMTIVTWAIPSNVILIGGILSGSSLLAIFVAVALASVRMMPMVVSIVPELRGEGIATWKLIVLAHFTAITSWVFGMKELPVLPPHGRAPFFGGFAVSLAVLSVGIVALGHGVAGAVPPEIAAALFLMTPLYFILTLPSAARLLSDKLALVFGFILGPLFALVVPEMGLVLTGLVGGLGAYGIGYYWRKHA
ncbi:Predicted branched-chain amino acid permease (azaleucine resistance) [Cohaesibacter marisflavi]|uniref:Predicted branched-chain amino acid permease (Azaleucine resistance) n=3 Tax=Cohaesibacter marisflavi TaxID=655353 RepID=A0A1I5G2M2_9HYPH|nr:Predicted branched-chain amino acid permease (azaleucine resistance) [Cohaesibacter marisflavi]